MPDPFALFAGYATQTLSPDSIIAPGASHPDVAELMASPFTLIGPELVLDQAGVARLVALCERLGQTTLASILAQVPPADRPLAARTLLWLAKWGRVRLIP